MMTEEIDGREADDTDHERGGDDQCEQDQDESEGEETTDEQDRAKNPIMHGIHETIEISEERIDDVVFALFSAFVHCTNLVVLVGRRL